MPGETEFVPASDALTAAFRDYQQRKSRRSADGGRATLAATGAAIAGRDPNAVYDKYLPRGTSAPSTGLSPEALAQAKIDLLDARRKYDEALRSPDASKAERLKARNDVFIRTLEQQLQLAGKKMAADASVASSRNDAMRAVTTKIMEENPALMNQALEASSPGNAVLLSKAKALIDTAAADASAQVSGVFGSSHIQQLVNLASTMGAADKAKMFIEIENSVKAMGTTFEAFQEQLATASFNGDAQAERLNEILSEGAAQVEDAAYALMEQNDKLKEEFEKTLARGVAGVSPEQFNQMVANAKKAADTATTPDEVEAIVTNAAGDAATNSGPDTADQLAKFDTALEELGAAEAQYNPTLRMVRDELTSSEEFKAFKEARGIPDNKLALKQLQIEVNQQNLANKAKSRESMEHWATSNAPTRIPPWPSAGRRKAEEPSAEKRGATRNRDLAEVLQPTKSGDSNLTPEERAQADKPQ